MDIVVQNVTKKFGTQKALDNVSFTVKTGEILGFLGPNGAGKTTTMKAITCFLMPNEGDIKVGGYSIKENPDEIKLDLNDHVINQADRRQEVGHILVDFGAGQMPEE